MFKFWQRQYHPQVFLESENTTTGINRSPDYINEHGVRRYQRLLSWFWEAIKSGSVVDITADDRQETEDDEDNADDEMVAISC